VGFKLVILPPYAMPDWPEKLRAAVPECDVSVFDSPAAARDAIVDADAAYGDVGPELLRRAGKLRWIQAPVAAPPAGYYYPELVASDVVVTNFRGIYSDYIGAHIMAFVLAFARGLQYYLPDQVQRRWRAQYAPIVHLPEATALIIGVGGIGAEAARMCAAFGMTVLGIDARRTDAPEGVSELHAPSDLHALLPRADFVIMTVPHTPQTEGMLAAGEFRVMKRSAFLINIGRGECVVLDDLVAALLDEEIAGAGLDVFELEPLPADHPLWTMPGVLLTPHAAAAGGTHIGERRTAVFVENCRRFAAGLPLHNVVDKAQWF
jgi:phosphoglycerate dehydrogenase-like enzyme